MSDGARNTNNARALLLLRRATTVAERRATTAATLLADGVSTRVCFGSRARTWRVMSLTWFPWLRVCCPSVDRPMISRRRMLARESRDRRRTRVSGIAVLAAASAPTRTPAPARGAPTLSLSRSWPRRHFPSPRPQHNSESLSTKPAHRTPQRTTRPAAHPSQPVLPLSRRAAWQQAAAPSHLGAQGTGTTSWA